MADNEKSSNEARILIIDDSDFSRKNIRDILVDSGYNIAGEANSAVSALHISQKISCNVFIIDVVMPETSGIELANHLNENSREEVFIIMVSSLDLDNIIIDSISAGAIDFIKKPFDKNTLIRSVEKVTERLQQKD
ncbi:MAG: response regulator [Bacteriovoracaceae bacterium]|nr:response regulator [Bacteriovoracaceae bacterium]